MSRKEEIENKAWQLLSEMTSDSVIQPVDVEYVKTGGDYTLNVYIDKENGVSIDDCEETSRAFEKILDDEDLIKDAYTLVVSSPGLGRKIVRPRDFEFALGKEIDVSFYKAVDNEKSITGILKSFGKDFIELQLEDDTRTYAKKEISAIHLTFEM